jgi:small GTP-binding protein
LGAKVSRKRMMFPHPKDQSKIELKMMIWDVMGQKEYGMLHRSAYQGSQGALIVCDTTRRKTFENLTSWISGLFNITGQIPIVLLGNKCDLKDQMQITHQDLINTGSTFTAPAFLASAFTGANVQQSFTELGNNMIQIDLNEFGLQ